MFGRPHREKRRLTKKQSGLDEVAAQMPFAGVNALKQNLQQAEQPNIESTIQKIAEALADADQLCRASIETGNAIRLLW